MVNSGIGGRISAKSAPSPAASKGKGSIARPKNVAPCSSDR
jgi:hypothetical protein